MRRGQMEPRLKVTTKLTVDMNGRSPYHRAARSSQGDGQSREDAAPVVPYRDAEVRADSSYTRYVAAKRQRLLRAQWPQGFAQTRQQVAMILAHVAPSCAHCWPQRMLPCTMGATSKCMGRDHSSCQPTEATAWPCCCATPSHRDDGAGQAWNQRARTFGAARLTNWP